MGASESKLVFKQGIFRLSEERNIAANDPYWTNVSMQETKLTESLTDGVSSGNSLSPLKMSSACSRIPISEELETPPLRISKPSSLP